MEAKNIGVFVAEIIEATGKYTIVYIEKGERVVLDGYEYVFDTYDEADDYINTHLEELNHYITEYKKSLGIVEETDDETQESEKTDDETQESEETDEEELEEVEESEVDENKEDKKNNGLFIRFLSGFLAAVITLVGGHFIAKGISESIKEKNDSGYSDSVDPIVQEKPLTTEEFQNLTANFTKLYTDKSLNVKTEDLVKFVSIVNIDKLMEDSPELAKELFASQSKEEYLNDAAKIIGLTYTYNRNVYQQTGETAGFIRISDAVYGEQKSALQYIETYVDLIAANSYDTEEANLYLTGLVSELGDPTSEISYLDDGVGFGMQVSIELIRSCIAKDVINQKNLDALTILTSSEEYVANIFTQYDKCNQAYTKTRN